uniref:Wsv161-like protein n=1 Tax=Melicertus latisulcatus majanivirus TaxID=2984277 RepID=A0A9C7C883_9VIRU|nr:MAG: wsv161-like protein [Melicertus latisulcatus majanivirus]
MSNRKIPWPILRSRIQDKNEKNNKENDIISMGMSIENKGPIKPKRQIRKTAKNMSQQRSNKRFKKNQSSKQQEELSLSSSSSSSSPTPPGSFSSSLSTIKQVSTPLPLITSSSSSSSMVSKEGKCSSVFNLPNAAIPMNKSKRKNYNKRSPVKKKCTNMTLYRNPPLPPYTKKLPKIIRINISNRLRRILMEEINIPIRERTQEKKRYRTENLTRKNKVYNIMLRKFLNFDNSLSKIEVEDTKIQLNENLKKYQIDNLKQTLEERTSYETFCTLLFDLFNISQLLNKQFQSNLVLIDIQKPEIKELSFADYKKRLLSPIWKKMSQSIEKIIGSSEQEFDKCLKSIIGKVETFEKAVNDLKKTMVSISHIQPKERKNDDKQMNNDYQSDMIKRQQELIQMQDQLIKQQNTIIHNSSNTLITENSTQLTNTE